MKLHALLRQRERAGDEGLRGDDGGERRDRDDGIEKGTRRQEVERVLDGVGNAQHQGALPEIVEQERGKDKGEPGEADGSATEVPHVRVQRFRPGHDEHDRAEHQKAGSPVIEEELDTVPRAQRAQNRGPANDLEDAERRDRPEPREHDRTEDAAHPRRPVLLKEKEQEEDEQRGRKHVGLKRRCGDLETFSGAEHGDCRRDDTVTVQQGGAEEPQRGQQATSPPLSQQGEQRYDAAFAAIVQTHDEGDVLDAHDEDQRPDDEREHAVDRRDSGRQPVLGVEACPEGVERAGADIAVDDAQGGQGQSREAPSPRVRFRGRAMS